MVRHHPRRWTIQRQRRRGLEVDDTGTRRIQAFAADRSIVDPDFPFLGCCYGVGTLGSVVGASVDGTYSEPVAAVTITLTVAGRHDPLFAELPDIFDAYGGHKEGSHPAPTDVVCLHPQPAAQYRRSV